MTENEDDGVLLATGVPLQWAYEAAAGCQSIVAGTWVPRSEPQRLAAQEELRVAVGGADLPWGAEYLNASAADQLTWAWAGVSQGDVWAASPMPYTPWGDILIALALLADLAEALPGVVTWEEGGLDVLGDRILLLSTEPADADALEGAASLVTLAWGEAFRVVLEQLSGS